MQAESDNLSMSAVRDENFTARSLKLNGVDTAVFEGAQRDQCLLPVLVAADHQALVGSHGEEATVLVKAEAGNCLPSQLNLRDSKGLVQAVDAASIMIFPRGNQKDAFVGKAELVDRC